MKENVSKYKNKIKIIMVKKGQGKKIINTQSMIKQYQQAQLEKDINRWQLNPILEKQEVFEGGLSKDPE